MTRTYAGITWEMERPGAWVSRIGRIERRGYVWHWLPAFAFAAAHPGVGATSYSLQGCAVLAARRWRRAFRRWLMAIRGTSDPWEDGVDPAEFDEEGFPR